MREVSQIALKHSMACIMKMGKTLWRDLAVTLPLEQR